MTPPREEVAELQAACVANVLTEEDSALV